MNFLVWPEADLFLLCVQRGTSHFILINPRFSYLGWLSLVELCDPRVWANQERTHGQILSTRVSVWKKKYLFPLEKTSVFASTKDTEVLRVSQVDCKEWKTFMKSGPLWTFHSLCSFQKGKKVLHTHLIFVGVYWRPVPKMSRNIISGTSNLNRNLLASKCLEQVQGKKFLAEVKEAWVWHKIQEKLYFLTASLIPCPSQHGPSASLGGPSSCPGFSSSEDVHKGPSSQSFVPRWGRLGWY